jgi:uridylate kinase
MSYQGVNYMRQGDQAHVIGGKLVVAAGGSIVPASTETKAANIANFTSSANMSAAQVTKLNALLVAMRGIGVLATS